MLTYLAHAMYCSLFLNAFFFWFSAGIYLYYRFLSTSKSADSNNLGAGSTFSSYLSGNRNIPVPAILPLFPLPLTLLYC